MDERAKVEVPLKMVGSSGWLKRIMYLPSLKVDVCDGDEKLGSVSFTNSGTILIRIRRGEKYYNWTISPNELFQAVNNGLDHGVEGAKGEEVWLGKWS